MKYHGLIVWNEFRKPVNIYQYDADLVSNALVYNCKVTAIISGKEINIFFNITGWGYSVAFKHVKENIYEGEIIKMQKVHGTAILHLYTYDLKHFCRIHWYEGKVFECFMELLPIS